MAWSTFWAGVATVATVLFGTLTYMSNKENQLLQVELQQLQKRLSGFDVNLDADGTLVMSLDGSVFSEPDQLTVQPVFESNDDPVILGQPIEIALDTGLRDVSKGTIRFSQIVYRVCQGSNQTKCDQLSGPRLLRVNFVVNGDQVDADDILLPRT
ncbi:MAG: hypothetical protein KDK24_06230 [Pseudooceanicola sp.]|nr:hypothetical protein [Pseudooceanicola sp.]